MKLNRDIKFRAWDTTRGMWLRSFENRGMSFGYGNDSAMSEYGCYSLDQIIEEFQTLIVTQFTGLYDSNGKEIYEGDLVQAVKPNSYLDGIYEVAWHPTKGRWYYNNQPSYRKDLYQVGRVGNQKCVVVGNIFEHLHLRSNED